MLRGQIINITCVLLLLLLVILDWQIGISARLYGAISLVYLLANGLGSLLIYSQFFIFVRCQGDRTRGSIAITFDDGPIAGKTDKILEILKQHEAPAAFFCIGSRVDQQPELVQRIHQEGHLVGNHSYYHGKMFDLQSSKQMEQELINTNHAIEKSIGRKPRFFRPPYGVTNPMLAKAVAAGNYTTVGWNIRSFDSVIKGKRRLFNRVTKKLKAGDLVLFHDYAASTLDLLPEFLDCVKRKGLKIERLDTLLHENPYA